MAELRPVVDSPQEEPPDACSRVVTEVAHVLSPPVASLVEARAVIGEPATLGVDRDRELLRVELIPAEPEAR